MLQAVAHWKTDKVPGQHDSNLHGRASLVRPRAPLQHRIELLPDFDAKAAGMEADLALSAFGRTPSSLTGWQVCSIFLATI